MKNISENEPTRTVSEIVIGPARIDVVPTRHFTDRFNQRIFDVMPEVDPTREFQAAGTLVRGKRAGFYFLDVDGVGRLVLKLEQAKYLGITVLPRIHCYSVQGGA